MNVSESECQNPQRSARPLRRVRVKLVISESVFLTFLADTFEAVVSFAATATVEARVLLAVHLSSHTVFSFVTLKIHQ